MRMMTLAVSKGRILEETLPLLNAAGIYLSESHTDSRKLILDTNKANLRIIIVRATDVPTYVRYGSADMGIAGEDVLLEANKKGLYQPLSLGIAKCRLSVAAPQHFDYEKTVQQGARIRVATKYVRTTRQFFAKKGVYIDLIKLYGSMELAPLTGLADMIVDLVSSGATLRANRLVELEKITDINAQLVVGQAALKLKQKAIKPLIQSLQNVVPAH
jgi:ATP phosphoribosyltransferase